MCKINIKFEQIVSHSHLEFLIHKVETNSKKLKQKNFSTKKFPDLQQRFYMVMIIIYNLFLLFIEWFNIYIQLFLLSFVILLLTY